LLLSGWYHYRDGDFRSMSRCVDTFNQDTSSCKWQKPHSNYSIRGCIGWPRVIRSRTISTTVSRGWAWSFFCFSYIPPFVFTWLYPLLVHIGFLQQFEVYFRSHN
jgi:AMMECR1 domain-containing protein